MKLKLASFLFISLLATGCSHQPTETSNTPQQKTAIPSWVMKTPQIKGSYNSVASVALQDDTEKAKQEAFAKASQQLESELLAQLKEQYEARLKQQGENYGNYEKAVRQQVRDNLPKISLIKPQLKESFVSKEKNEVFVWAQLSQQPLTDDLEKALVTFDDHLRNYLHVSGRGSNLSQILSILPALPTLEARNQIKTYLEDIKGEAVAMPNDRLALLLDRQLTNKFDEMVVSMNAQTEDTEQYDPLILKAMTQRGFNVSARKPDLMIKYFVEPEFFEEKDMKKLALIADAEMIGEQGDAFATISKEYQGMAKYEEEATQQAIDAFCDDMTTSLVDASLQYMARANKNQPLPEVYAR